MLHLPCSLLRFDPLVHCPLSTIHFFPFPSSFSLFILFRCLSLFLLVFVWYWSFLTLNPEVDNIGLLSYSASSSSETGIHNSLSPAAIIGSNGERREKNKNRVFRVRCRQSVKAKKK